MSANTHITGSEHVSRKAMIDLLENKQGTKERMAAKAHIKTCPLCSEAYEGLKQMPDTAALHGLNNKWKSIASKHRLKKIELNLNWIYIIFTFVFIIIIALVYLFFFYQPAAIKNVAEHPAVTSAVSAGINKQPESFIVNKNAVENEAPPTPGKIPAEETNPEIEAARRFSVEPLKTKEVNPLIPNPYPEPVAKSYNNIKTKAILDFIIIDYTDDYVNDKDAWKQLNNGIAARYANKFSIDSMNDDNGKSSYKTTYESVMDHAFHNLHNGKYETSLEDFSFILQYFPNDMNCFFYSGFALENNLKFKEASEFYKQVMYSQNPVFTDAARFHEALCLIEMKDVQSAKAILNTLVESDSFYAKQAKEKLSQLK